MARLPEQPALVSALTLGLGIFLGIGAASSSARTDVIAAQLYTYVRAFLEAPVIVQGDVVSYKPTRGAELLEHTVMRADLEKKRTYRLSGSSHYAFLAAKPGDITAFIGRQNGLGP